MCHQHNRSVEFRVWIFKVNLNFWYGVVVGSVDWENCPCVGQFCFVLWPQASPYMVIIHLHLYQQTAAYRSKLLAASFCMACQQRMAFTFLKIKKKKIVIKHTLYHGISIATVFIIIVLYIKKVRFTEAE